MALPGDDVPVGEVVDRFIAEWGSGSWRDASAGDHVHEAGILRLSIDKAIARLDWRPRWGLDRVLAETARWYRRWLEDPAAMREFGLAQIAAYERAMEGADARPDEPAAIPLADHSGPRSRGRVR